MNEKTVVLWSHSQGYFHIETYAAMITINMRAYVEGRPMDYVLIAILDTHKEASEVIRRLESIKERHALQAAGAK